MGVVGGEEEELLGAYHLEHLVEVLGVLGVLHRLRGEAHLLPYVFARHPLYPRHLTPEASVVVIEAPHCAGYPGPAGFDHHDPEFGESVEDAMTYKAYELALP